MQFCDEITFLLWLLKFKVTISMSSAKMLIFVVVKISFKLFNFFGIGAIILRLLMLTFACIIVFNVF